MVIAAYLFGAGVAFLILGAVWVWSLNTLFGFGIPYTVKTILAAAVLGGILSGGSSRSKE